MEQDDRVAQETAYLNQWFQAQERVSPFQVPHTSVPVQSAVPAISQVATPEDFGEEMERKARKARSYRAKGLEPDPPASEPDRCTINWCCWFSAENDPDGLCSRCRTNVDSWKV